MKSFMEEYGKIVVAAIVVMIFAVVASPIGNGLRDGVTKVASTLTNNVKESFAGAEGGAGGAGNAGGSGEEEPVALAAGLYDENDVMVASWEQLIDYNLLTVENGVLKGNSECSDCGENKYIDLEGKLVIDNNVTNIGGYSFGCFSCNCGSRLTEIVIPNSVTNISRGAFIGCSSLVTITIPDSIASIEPSAFMCCSSLSTIYIPSSVTTIESGNAYSSVFYGCSDTLEIYCETSEVPSGWNRYWNYYDDSNTLDVNCGVTKAEYEALIAE